MTQITIGKLSAHTGVNIETIRYYEKIGMLPEPERSKGGHRLYDADLLRRLIFIRSARNLGFTLEDIRSLLGLEGRPLTCAEVNGIATNHLATIHTKIDMLKSLESTLTRISRKCRLDSSADCFIIDALYERQGKPRK